MKKINIKLGLVLCLLFNIIPAHAISTHNIFVTTFSILSYAKWSTAVQTPSFCVIDNTSLANQFKTVSQQYNQNYQIHSISLNDLSSFSCQVVFFSTLTPQQEQSTLNDQAQPILSFSTNNSACEVGSSFCLYKKNQLTSFKVNLDSLSQSKVRIDPRVLLLAKPAEQRWYATFIKPPRCRIYFNARNWRSLHLHLRSVRLSSSSFLPIPWTLMPNRVSPYSPTH